MLGARGHLALDQPARALETAQRAYEAQRATLATGDADLLSSIRLIADIHRQAGERADEVAWRQRLLEQLDGSEAFAEADNVESNIRLLQLAIAGGFRQDIATLRSVIDNQLARGGDDLERAAVQYRALIETVD